MKDGQTHLWNIFPAFRCFSVKCFQRLKFPRFQQNSRQLFCTTRYYNEARKFDVITDIFGPSVSIQPKIFGNPSEKYGIYS
jgi:hypothetical protein